MWLVRVRRPVAKRVESGIVRVNELHVKSNVSLRGREQLLVKAISLRGREHAEEVSEGRAKVSEGVSK